MIDPQNDEERKALRLLDALHKCAIPSGFFASTAEREDMLCILSEARAILREEQKPSELNECTGSELYRVRDEIRLRSEVLRAFPDLLSRECPEGEECTRQNARFLALLRRERELMGDSWVTNG